MLIDLGQTGGLGLIDLFGWSCIIVAVVIFYKHNRK